jgi:hypothetical protein
MKMDRYEVFEKKSEVGCGVERRVEEKNENHRVLYHFRGGRHSNIGRAECLS